LNLPISVGQTERVDAKRLTSTVSSKLGTVSVVNSVLTDRQRESTPNV
jgi:hypothetical protein